MIKKCEVCKIEFSTKGNKKYCSKKCYEKGQRGKLLENDIDTIKRCEKMINEPMDEYLKRRYIDELATYREIMVELGLSENGRRLKRWLKHYGIEIRNPSESVRTQHIRNPERKKDFGKMVQTQEVKIKRAKARQANRRLSTLEKAAKSIIDEYGFYVEGEYAIDIFNIDLALPDYKIAIEINGGNWHEYTDKKKNQDMNKKEFLEKNGWKVHYFQAKDFGKLINLLNQLKGRC